MDWESQGGETWDVAALSSRRMFPSDGHALLQLTMCAGIHRSRVSPSPRKGAFVPGCTNQLSFCQGARNRTAAAWESLYVKWSEFDLLSIQSWVARENLLWFGSLAQHIRNKFDWN